MSTADLANSAIVPFEGRDIHSATTVFVYRNLHKSVWSIVAVDGPHKGLVIGHASHVLLDHARWRVNLSGRLRVLASKQRNVHAGVVGMLADKEPTDDALSWDRVSYNPFRAAHFYLADIGPDGSRVDSTRYAMLGMNGIVYAA